MALDQRLLAYDYYLGFDVGKFFHHACAIRSSDQKIVFSRRVAQDEQALREIISEAAFKGSTLVSVDQKGALGSLVIAIAKDLGVDVGFIPPYDFKQYSDAYAEAKTDAVDAYVIADISMRMTHRLYPVGDTDERLYALKVLTTHRSALVAESTRDKNRLHDLLTKTHPALERVFDKSALDSSIYLRILEQYGGSEGLSRAGRKRLEAFIAKQPYAGGKAESIAEKIFSAIDKQTFTVAAVDVTESIIRSLAGNLLCRRVEISALEEQIAAYYALFPESAILSSIPGVGDTLGPVILAEIGNIDRFGSAAELAAYAGVGPSKKQSGVSRGTSVKKKRCNRALKNALCTAAQCAARSHDLSAAYYDRKRAEGKSHKQSVLALARRRTDMIFAMLVTGSLYDQAINAKKL